MYNINAYICHAGHTTVTRDKGEGILPVFIDCSMCREIATLQGKPEGNVEPEFEWYVPVKRKGITKEENKKYRQHGIYLRKIKPENNEEQETKSKTAKKSKRA